MKGHGIFSGASVLSYPRTSIHTLYKQIPRFFNCVIPDSVSLASLARLLNAEIFILNGEEYGTMLCSCSIFEMLLACIVQYEVFLVNSAAIGQCCVS